MRTILCFLMLAALAGATPDTNVTGKWTGSFNVTGPEGQTKESTALLVLNQEGTNITGTVGPDEGEQRAITKGRIEGDKLTLEVAEGGAAITFNLAVSGDRITGEATATGEGRTMKAKIDVGRVK